MAGFLLAFGLVFLAELGDKTQLVALTFATRFNPWVVLAGIASATAVLNVLSVLLGSLVGEFLPVAWVKFAAGLAFIGFGAWTLRNDCSEEAKCDDKSTASPFWIVAVTFFLGELGDKTMLSTLTLAATHAAIPVWLGATAGMILCDGLAILVGTALGSRLPQRLVQVGAAIIFFVFGGFSLIQAAVALPPRSLLLGLTIAVAAAIVVIRPYMGARKKKKEALREIETT